MSKKTKRLEKENVQLNRRHDALNRNVLEMAQEREKNSEEVTSFKLKNKKLTDIINQMQRQGRGLPSASNGTTGTGVEGGFAQERSGDAMAEGDTESDYEYEDEDEDEVELGSEGEYDDDTEEESIHPQPFGPVPPPPAAAAQQIPTANGFKH